MTSEATVTTLYGWKTLCNLIPPCPPSVTRVYLRLVPSAPPTVGPEHEVTTARTLKLRSREKSELVLWVSHDQDLSRTEKLYNRRVTSHSEEKQADKFFLWIWGC